MNHLKSAHSEAYKEYQQKYVKHQEKEKSFQVAIANGSIYIKIEVTSGTLTMQEQNIKFTSL